MADENEVVASFSVPNLEEFFHLPTPNEPKKEEEKAEVEEPQVQEEQSRLTMMTTFHQIRRRFEENSLTSQASLLIPNTSDSPEGVNPLMTDFQRLYPIYKDYFSKRQFAATERCFQEADKNGDGFLESKEIKQMLVDHNHQVNLCDADFIVNLGDQDQDGKLSPKEFLELCKPTCESLKQQHHMEGSFPPSDKEFIGAIVEKLRSLVSPVSAKVKGTRQFFENMISNGSRVVAVKDKEMLLRRPLKKNTVLQEALRTGDK